MIRKSLPSVPTTQAFMAASNSPLNGAVASASSQPATVQDIQQLLGQLGLHNQPTKAATTQAFYTNRGGMGRGHNFHNRRGRGSSNARNTGSSNMSQFSWASTQNTVFGTCNRYGSTNHATRDLLGLEYAEPYYGEDNLHVQFFTLVPNVSFLLIKSFL
ncbi:hypothetical protein E3N88_16672 [Mikania micrantha]|uniref:Uncharacterized protein n=1 Tax=Mikania micrantha TaxID=192012 RepID=A0A5N6NZF5_9ASTR|nr:hypothetical protein E3N88_16672 [Mikania micrantha]